MLRFLRVGCDKLRGRGAGKEAAYLDNETLPADLCKERATSNLDRKTHTGLRWCKVGFGRNSFIFLRLK